MLASKYIIRELGISVHSGEHESLTSLISSPFKEMFTGIRYCFLYCSDLERPDFFHHHIE